MPEVSAPEETFSPTNAPAGGSKPFGVNWSTIIISTVVAAILLGGALALYKVGTKPFEQATPYTKQSSPSAKQAETADWKTYTNKDLNFSVKYPSDWTVDPKAKLSATDSEGIIIKGIQGMLEINWTDQYGGGGCKIYETIKIKNKTLSFCHVIDDKGNETWNGVFTSSGTGTSPIIFGSVKAYIPNETNRQTILTIVSTLDFY